MINIIFRDFYVITIIARIAINYLVLFYEQISVIIVLLIFNFELVALVKTNLFFFDISVHKSWLIASLHFMFFFLSILVKCPKITFNFLIADCLFLRRYFSINLITLFFFNNLLQNFFIFLIEYSQFYFI